MKRRDGSKMYDIRRRQIYVKARGKAATAANLPDAVKTAKIEEAEKADKADLELIKSRWKCAAKACSKVAVAKALRGHEPDQGPA